MLFNDGEKNPFDLDPAGAPAATLEDYVEDLRQLVGLRPVKRKVNQLFALAQVIKAREDFDPEYRGHRPTLHMVFSGPPGTGKTTVARLLGDIFRELGFLRSGHLVEVGAADLIAGFVGQTRKEVQKKVRDARDGVLFIDEAYGLAQGATTGGGGDYGSEAIEELIRAIENERGKMVCILAGYPTEMERLLDANTGMRSRFPHQVTFESYDEGELLEILLLVAQMGRIPLDEVAKAEAQTVIARHFPLEAEDFGNAREMRRMFERLQSIQAERLARGGDITNLDREELFTIRAEDVRSFADEQKRRR